MHKSNISLIVGKLLAIRIQYLFESLKSLPGILLYSLFSIEKRDILILHQIQFLVSLSVRPSITFFVNVCPPKPLRRRNFKLCSCIGHMM